MIEAFQFCELSSYGKVQHFRVALLIYTLHVSTAWCVTLPLL